MNDHSTFEEELLVEALALPAETRRAFIERRCGTDNDSANRLFSLLRGFQENSSFLETSAPVAALQSAGRTFAALPPEPEPGDRINRYHLLKRIGEGGFGVVYLAEQEEPVRRLVALKVIRLGLDTREFIARFEAERQALAVMDHPNIARVFDAGATETGRPFLVMELIRGIPITAYCDEHKLSVPDRLGLFLQVCNAIQHAHQKGIIHCDLKPSNILIELHDPPEAGCPKVIDFGIAKATPDRRTNKTLFTRFHALIGTPAYTSPEQMELSGLDVDTRSDIYSLGVLLYELLTGHQPFDPDILDRASLEEMRRLIREVDPPRPSARVGALELAERSRVAQRRGLEPEKLLPLLRSDLDWIVMRCLEKDRTRRYETANGLAMDLRRHLACEPVVARPPSRSYKIEKFVRRNRTGVIAATAVVIALFAGLVLASVGFARAKVQQHAAETARREAEDLVSFMVKDLKPELQRVGRLPLTTQVAERAVRYFSSLPPDLNHPSTERNRAIALEALAGVRSASGDKKSAASLWHDALETRRRAVASAPHDPLFAVELALTEFIEESHSFPLVSSYAWGTGSPEIDARLTLIVNRAREASRAHLGNRDVALGFAHVLVGYANYLNMRTILPAEGLSIGREAEGLFRAIRSGSPDDATLGAEYVRLMMTIATATAQSGDKAGGIETAEAALASADRELTKNPGNIELRENAADAAMQLCYRLSATSWDKARAAGATARKRWDELLQTDPQNFNYRYRNAWAHHYEADFLYVLGRKTEAGAFAERFASLLGPVAQSGADILELRGTHFRLAACWAQLGDIDRSRKQFAVAQEWHRKYIAAFAAGAVNPTGVHLRYLDEMCASLECMADWPELERQARALFAEITDVQRLNPALPPALYERADAGYFLGRALLEQGRSKDAIPIFHEAARDSELEYAQHKPAPPVDQWSLFVRGGLAEALVTSGDHQEARIELEKNLAAWTTLAASPFITWDSRAKQAEVGYLLATVLNPSVPQEQQRRATLLEHAEIFLENHPAGNPLNWHDAELLVKIKALRGVQCTR